MTLSKDEILATGIPDEVVDVPEWGGKVRIRGLSADERESFEETLVERGEDGNFVRKENLFHVRASFVTRCVIDDNGERVFVDEDAPALSQKSAAAIGRLWDRARKLSGMGSEEELAQLFAKAQDGDSASA